MRSPVGRQAGNSRLLAMALAIASLSAGYLSFQLVSAAEWAPGVLVGSFALLIGALAAAAARRAPDPGVAPPVRFVPHAYLAAVLILTVLAILAALLLPMLRR